MFISNAPVVVSSQMSNAAEDDAKTGKLTDIFKRACYDGSVRLPPTEMTPVQPREVPERIRTWFRTGTENTYYRLAEKPASYLILYKSHQKSPTIGQGCALATRAVSMNDFIDAASGEMGRKLREMGVPPPANPDRWELPRPKEGYIVTVSRISDGFVVGQVTMLTPLVAAQRAWEQDQKQRDRLRHPPRNSKIYGPAPVN